MQTHPLLDEPCFTTSAEVSAQASSRHLISNIGVYWRRQSYRGIRGFCVTQCNVSPRSSILLVRGFLPVTFSACKTAYISPFLLVFLSSSLRISHCCGSVPAVWHSLYAVVIMAVVRIAHAVSSYRINFKAKPFLNPNSFLLVIASIWNARIRLCIAVFALNIGQVFNLEKLPRVRCGKEGFPLVAILSTTRLLFTPYSRLSENSLPYQGLGPLASCLTPNTSS